MGNSIFLSIDMDYFFGWASEEYGMREFEKFFGKILKLDIRPKIFVEHHEMLPFINHGDYDEIIHIDYHDDLVAVRPGDKKVFNLDCGTFLYYVKRKAEMIYQWRYPDLRCNYEWCGRCNGGIEGDDTYDVHSKRNWTYKKHSCWKGLRGLNISKDNVKFIGICISPEWSLYENIPYMIKMLGPYMGGRLKGKLNDMYYGYQYGKAA